MLIDNNGNESLYTNKLINIVRTQGFFRDLRKPDTFRRPKRMAMLRDPVGSVPVKKEMSGKFLDGNIASRKIRCRTP